MDAGWIKTTDMIYEEHAKKIIESVLDHMVEDYRARFNWADTYFFARWYKEADTRYKELAHKFVKEGKFYFVNGGWVEHDESIPDYRSAIEQMVVGQQFLNETFGIVPHIGWQVNSFGETAITPSIYAMLGIDSLVNSRIGYSAKTEFKNSQSLNFIWEGHKISSHMDKYRIFTHPIIGDYKIPSPYDFSDENTIHCPEPFIDIKRSHEFFEKVIKPNMYTYDKSDDIAIVFGSDNLYENAYMTFYCIDNFMAEVQRLVRDYTNFKYLTYKFATIEEYVEQVQKTHKENGWKLPYYNGDFVPYDNRIEKQNSNSKYAVEEYTEFWTGFYTTRPVIKQQIRDLMHNVRVINSVYSINHLNRKNFNISDDENFDNVTCKNILSGDPSVHNYTTSQIVSICKDYVTMIKQEASRMLHHHTISGTHPSNTYSLDFNKTITDTNHDLFALLKILHLNNLKLHFNESAAMLMKNNAKSNDLLTNDISEDFYPIIMYNPTLQERNEIVNVTVKGVQAIVFDEEFKPIKSQIMH